MKIETFCRNCDKSFSFKSKLYKHLYGGYVIKKLIFLITKLFTNLKKSKSHFFARKFNLFITKLFINLKKSKSHFFARKFNLIIIKLFINLKKSKSHFAIVEVSRIIKFIIFTFDQSFEFDFKN